MKEGFQPSATSRQGHGENLRGAEQPSSSAQLHKAVSPRDVFILAASFGLTCGLLEGAGMFALQELRLMHWRMAMLAVSIEIVWISAFFDVVLFLLAGCCLMGATYLLPRVPWLRTVVFLFLLICFFDWLSLSGRISGYGCVVLAAGFAATTVRLVEPARILGFCRRTLPWLTGAALLVFAGIESGTWWMEKRALASLPLATEGARNVLVIVVDTLRADHVSSYGYGRSTTPNLDRLAGEGVLFEEAFSTSSWTPPSHASLLTGCYLYEHGTEEQPYDGRFPTLAEVLRDRGYRTAAISGNFWFFNRRLGFGRGFIRFEDYFHSLADMFARTLYGRKVEKHLNPRLGIEEFPRRRSAASINQAVVNWMERDPSRPFFVFVNYFDVHDPYRPPAPYGSSFSAQTSPGGVLNWTRGRRHPPLTPEELQSEIDAYDGAVAYVDSQLGSLVAELKAQGLEDKTIVVITSDHGEGLGNHGLYLHRNSLYRELIHVPLVVWAPGLVPAGQRIARPVSNASIPATLFDLLGIRNQTTFASPSLSLLWQNPAVASKWPFPLSEMKGSRFETKTSPAYHGWLKSLVSPEWHYIRSETLGASLFDLRNDPQERNDISKQPELNPVLKDFESRLQNVLTSSPQAHRSQPFSTTFPPAPPHREASP